MINIAILSAKGGTGKTTLSIALAHQYAVANPGREIVLVDADNQGNVAISLNLRGENTLGAYLYEATDTLDLLQYRPEIPFLVVESGRMHLYEAEKRIHRAEHPAAYFRDHLLPEFNPNALVIWDLPPTLSIINDNVIYIADFIVIPTHTDYLSLTGISNLLTYLEAFRAAHPVRCRLLGIADHPAPRARHPEPAQPRVPRAGLSRAAVPHGHPAVHRHRHRRPEPHDAPGGARFPGTRGVLGPGAGDPPTHAQRQHLPWLDGYCLPIRH